MTDATDDIRALVATYAAAGMPRSDALARLKAAVEAEERAARRRPCEVIPCAFDAIANVGGEWCCGHHMAARQRDAARMVTR